MMKQKKNVMILDNKKLLLNFPTFGMHRKGFVFEVKFFNTEKEGQLCLSCVSVANQEKVDVKLLVSSLGCLQYCSSSLHCTKCEQS